MSALLWLSWAVPLGLAASIPLWRSPQALAHGLWLAPVPALVLAIFGGPLDTLQLPWVLFGTRLGLDGTARAFLLLTALLWSIGGAYSAAYLRGDPRIARYVGFFLVAQAGNLLLIVCQDIATFYLGFATMTFSAFGLVVHDGSRAALRAGRVYIAMAVLGEAALLVAFLLMAAVADTTEILTGVLATAGQPAGATVAVLLVLGFGVKAGVPLLHMWLPLAHPVAPTPASAVLSGAIVKAGLLGWLRFLPLGEATFDWGAVLAAAGVVAMFGAVLLGLAQRDAKTALAYSTVSQMGYATVAVGVGLVAPQAWPMLLPAVTAYALHHGLAKGALFLGVGIARAAALPRGLVLLAMLLPAATLAGAPLTSGVLVKEALTGAFGTLEQPWVRGLVVLLPFAAVATTLLMARVVALAWREHGSSDPRTGMVAPWGVSLAAVAAAAWLAPAVVALEVPPPWKGMATLLGAWPIVVGAAIAGLAMWMATDRTGRRAVHRLAQWRIAPGDVLVPLERSLAPLLRAALRLGLRLDARSRRQDPVARREPAAAVDIAEARLETWVAAGAALLAIGLVLVLALAAG
jgi:formate hydrogenlyase subunit 3/multisubunit Na+/H+ antiporter MnhD subunit